MRAMARIDHDSYIEVIFCAIRNCCADMNQSIQDYWKEAHAIQAGWTATTDPKYHGQDSEQPYSWICPECMRQIKSQSCNPSA